MRNGRGITDKSTKAANEAEKQLRETEAALAASKRATNERAVLAVMTVAAEQNYRAALRAEKVPRVTCSRCQRTLKPDESMIWQWLPSWYHRRSVEVCLRCHRKEHKSEHASRLAEAEQRPCETCARMMYLDGYHRFHARRPLTCSYQCNYRRKLKHQLERKQVEHEPMPCARCGEMFTPTRSDANTCSSKCRQKLYRENRRALREQIGSTSGMLRRGRRDDAIVALETECREPRHRRAPR
jgi:hypothetical protein